MAEQTYLEVRGTIQSITSERGQCCRQIVTVNTDDGVAVLYVSPKTWIHRNTRLRQGMKISAFYDAREPVPLIYPPQYRAVAIVPNIGQKSAVLDYFNRNLTNAGGTLKLNVSPITNIVTKNGQRYPCLLTDQLLLVIYSRSTRSIPAQTTPEQVIVFCD